VLSAKDDPASVTKFASRMQHEAKRLTDLVQEIINLSRLQDSDPLLIAQENSVNDMIQVAVDQCQTIALARKIEVALADSPDASVLGDPEQITMAIHNLVENAINYSPENTKVSVTTSLEDGIVQVSVTDQGIGIPESDQARIFERFYRVDPARSRETGGTGLGLSIVKHVATKHGGEVKVWSSPNVGSTFALRLPIHANSGEIES
jgi:two-component system sensor histidine kinase SenX3